MKIDRRKVWKAVIDGKIDTTLACSIIAQGRYRVHGNRKRVLYDYLPAGPDKDYTMANGGIKVIEWTAERQAEWIDKTLATLRRYMPSVYENGKCVRRGYYEKIELSLKDFEYTVIDGEPSGTCTRSL